MSQCTSSRPRITADVDHHRQAWFLSEGIAPAEAERAERHGPAPDVEVPQEQDRGRSWCAPSMTAAVFLAEFFTGTIWSSSPCRTRVGTLIFLRSSVKSVSENALILSYAFF